MKKSRPTTWTVGQRWTWKDNADGAMVIVDDEPNWRFESDPATEKRGPLGDAVPILGYIFLGWATGYGPPTPGRAETLTSSPCPGAPGSDLPSAMGAYDFAGEPHPVGCLWCGRQQEHDDAVANWMCLPCTKETSALALWREWKAGARDFPRKPKLGGEKPGPTPLSSGEGFKKSPASPPVWTYARHFAVDPGERLPTREPVPAREALHRCLICGDVAGAAHVCERYAARNADPTEAKPEPTRVAPFNEPPKSLLCTVCSLGSACTHHRVRKPYVSAVDDWDLLPDAGR